ncbi:MAG: alkaline phosphatase family protein [Rhodobacter sp.]|nr:alkaline phosphatase family protein [Rhodobacter sp.]
MAAKDVSTDSQYLTPNQQVLKDRIDHIVVLMMENRSFDNLLGWLYEDERPPRGQSFDGLGWTLWNPLNNVDADGNPFVEKVGVRKNGSSYKLGHHTMDAPEVDYCLPRPDPGEGYRDATYQLFGTYVVDDLYPPEPLGQGYVNNYLNAMLYGTLTYHDAPTDPREIMTTFTPDQTPVLSGLAKAYAVCDQWFCSVPSQTLPNRDFIHAATSTGYVNNKPDNLCDSKTIYNQIQDAIDGGRDDLSWAVYSGTQQDRDSGKWEPFSLTRLCMKQVQDKGFDPNFKMMHEFYADAEAGTLPSYAFLEPQFSGPLQNDQHPPQDIRPGEKLMADVYHAVKASPCWERTLLVITYDEHGGCYDHLPPTATAKTPDAASTGGQMGFRFNRFGVRVPAVVISPLIEAGTVARPDGWTPYDHTSVIKTVQIAFDLEDHGPLTARDAEAPDLSGMLTLGDPRDDDPVIEAADYPEPEAVLVNDLHKISAEILAERLGVEHPTDDQIHDFIHKAYAQAFGH